MARQRKNSEIDLGKWANVHLNGGMSGSRLTIRGVHAGRLQNVVVPQLTLYEVKLLVQEGLAIIDGVARDAARMAAQAREVKG